MTVDSLLFSEYTLIATVLLHLFSMELYYCLMINETTLVVLYECATHMPVIILKIFHYNF